MKLVWVAILTLIAGSHDGPSVVRVPQSGSLAVDGISRAADKSPRRSPAVARRVEGRPSQTPWSTPLIEECDPWEVDETWMVDLDASTSVPIAWIAWALPRSSADGDSTDRSDPHSLRCIPLRC